jgi:transposase
LSKAGRNAGVGPVTATAIIATIGNGAAFRKGRDFAAWLGVVPEEHSTGGKQTLWKIPKRETTTYGGCWCKAPEPLCSTGPSSRLV